MFSLRVDPLPGVALFGGRALEPALRAEVEALLRAAPPRPVTTPYGPMSVTMGNCGAYGWTADRSGYRYRATDPATNRPWPPIPPRVVALARALAAEAGFPRFAPDACVVNRYAPGARMGLHQDRDEADLDAPVVSLSFGCAAVFVVKAGPGRTGPGARLTLRDGDALVLHGPARLAYHGIARVFPEVHPQWGNARINLTLRRAGPDERARSA